MKKKDKKLNKKAAKAAKISRETAYKYLKDSEFKAELDKRRSECLNDTVRFLQGKLTVCSEQLVRIIENEDTADQVKINAINTLFSNFKSMSETVEIIARLEEIERLMEAGDS
jgi:ACT domain-containing protein